MIANVVNNRLTLCPLVAILSALSPSLVAVRVSSRENQQMPIQARLFRRLRYSMQEIIYGGRYLGSESSHGSVAMSTNPHNVHRPKFSSFKRCPLTFNRDHTMSQNNSAQPTPDAYGIYRVNPDQKPPKGFKQLCNSCRFDKFSGAYRYCPNCGADADSHCQYVAINGGV